MGMSGVPDKGVIKVPDTRVNYRVILVDQSDVSTELTMFSCEGQTYFLGQRGKMEIFMDFANITEVRFFYQEPLVRAQTYLNKGEPLELLIKPNLLCYGISPWGNVRIAIKDIKHLTILGPVSAE